MKFSSKVQRCELSPMRKFHPFAVAAKAAGRTIYHLNIGQPDIATPTPAFDAVRHFQLPVLEYAPSPGIPELIEAVRGYYGRLGVELAEGDVLVTTGGSEALSIALNCVLDDGDEIIVPEPFYPNYNTFIQATGGVIRPLTTSPHDGYRYADRERLEAMINPRTRALLITNPGNPTGTVLTRAEMAMIADVVKRHDLFLIADEVYREFVYDGEELSSMTSFPEIAENTILIDSVSKRFSACGARVGVLISRNGELIQHALKFCQARLSVATLDQVAAAALYTLPADYFLQSREEYRRRRDTVYRKLKEIPGVVCECPDGAFYMMAKLPVDDADKFQEWLLTDFEDRGETVMFAPGAGFYATPGRGVDEIRIAYVTNPADIARGVEILGRGIEAYNARKA